MADFQPSEGLRRIVEHAIRQPEDFVQDHDAATGKPYETVAEWKSRAVLAALFEACEVREEWGVRSVVPDRGIPDYWRENRAQAEDTIAARSALGAHVRSSLIHRCALKTPVEVITPPISSTGEEKTGA